jgi:hypothetical protein
VKTSQIYIAMIIGLLLISSSPDLISQADTVYPKLAQVREVDICSDDPARRQCIYTIDLGAVEKKDSLFGYNFQVSFDGAKLKFVQGLFIGTLSAAFDEEYRKVVPGQDSIGTVAGYGIHINISAPPVSGDKPLVAMLFDWLPDKPDTATMIFDYIEFTQEYQKFVGQLGNAFVKIDYLDKPDRLLELSFAGDSLFFEKPTVQTDTIKFRTTSLAKLDRIEFELRIDNPNFDLAEIVAAEGSGLNIAEVSKINDGIYKVKLDVVSKFTESALTVRFSEIVVAEAVAGVKIENLTVNEFSCLTRFYTDSIGIRSQDTTPVSVAEMNSGSEISAYYNYNDDAFIFESEKDEINFATFFDLRGLLVKEINYFKNKKGRCTADAVDLNKGVYFVLLRTMSNKVYKIIVIK